jgi:hypothetical protein
MMLRSNLVLQVLILLTLLAGIGLNLEYWRTQRAFNQSTLERLRTDEGMLAACGCGARQAFIAIDSSPRPRRSHALQAPSPK